MAVTFRSSATATATSGASLSVNKPTGTADGDLLLAFFSRDQYGEEMITLPTGWAPLHSGYSKDGTPLQSFYKWAGGSEPASYSFTSGESTQEWTGSILAYAGAGAIHPGVTIETPSGTGAGATVTFPAFTTEVDDCLIIRAGAADGGNFDGARTPPTGHTERIDLNQSTNTSQYVCEIAAASAGTVAAATMTLASSTNQHGMSFALSASASPDPTDKSFIRGTYTAVTRTTHTDLGLNVPFHEDGDLLMAFIYPEATTVTLSAPSGWTQHVDVTVGVSGRRCAVYYRTASSEPAKYDFPMHTSAVNGSGRMISIGNSGGWGDLIYATNDNASSNTATCPDVTTVENGSVVIRAALHESSTMTVPSVEGTLGSIGRPTYMFGLAYETQALAGATGTFDFTVQSTRSRTFTYAFGTGAESTTAAAEVATATGTAHSLHHGLAEVASATGVAHQAAVPEASSGGIRRRGKGHEWRFLYAPLLDASYQVYGELPLSDVRFSRSLNQSGELTATVPYSYADGRPLTIEGEYPFGYNEQYEVGKIHPMRTQIVVMQGDVPVWAGVLWQISGSATGPTQIRCRDHSALLEKLLLPTTVGYSALWPVYIAQQLLAEGQDQTQADFGIKWALRNKDNVGTIPTGGTITREYFARDNHFILSAMEELITAGNSKPFDWYIEVEDDVLGQPWPKRTFVARQPEALTTTAVDQRLEYGNETANNIVDYRWVHEGSQLATHVKVLGFSVESVTQTYETTDFGGSDLLLNVNNGAHLGWPRQTQIFRNDGLRTANDVSNAGDDMIQYYARPFTDLVVTYPAALPPDPQPRPGIPIDEFELGDRIAVKITNGFLDVDEEFKCIGISWDLSNPVQPLVELTLRPAIGIGF